MNRRTSPTDTFNLLKGKTIKTVQVHGINCVSVETTDGKWFMIETVQMILGISGIEVLESTREECALVG